VQGYANIQQWNAENAQKYVSIQQAFSESELICGEAGLDRCVNGVLEDLSGIRVVLVGLAQ